MPTNCRKAGIAVASVLAATIALAPIATADTFSPTTIAQDPAVAPVSEPATSTARLVGVDADIPAGLTITGAQGKPVTVTTRDERARTRVGRDGAPVVFRNLTPGSVYTVYVGGTRVGTAVPVTMPRPARALTASTTDTRGSVTLTWKHRATRAEGAVTYEVAASPCDNEGVPLADVMPITATTTGTTIQLDGLRLDVRYTFTVAAVNSVGRGKESTAVMNRTLGQIYGLPEAEPAAPAPPTAPPATPPSVPTPSPSFPAPAPASAAVGPATVTVYVCPSGYVDAGSACTDTKAYTFHTETVTTPYTYHTGVIGSHIVTHPPTHCDYLPNPSSPSGLDIYCYGGYDETVLDYGQVKDPIPAGYTDSGTAWVKEVQVKDPAPLGYTDSGTAWVKTVAKVATTVAA